MNWDTQRNIAYCPLTQMSPGGSTARHIKHSNRVSGVLVISMRNGACTRVKTAIEFISHNRAVLPTAYFGQTQIKWRTVSTWSPQLGHKEFSIILFANKSYFRGLWPSLNWVSSLLYVWGLSSWLSTSASTS